MFKKKDTFIKRVNKKTLVLYYLIFLFSYLVFSSINIVTTIIFACLLTIICLPFLYFQKGKEEYLKQGNWEEIEKKQKLEWIRLEKKISHLEDSITYFKRRKGLD